MVSWGSLPEQVVSAWVWCWKGSELSYDRAYPLIAVPTELHTNALEHTASGTTCGRARMEMEYHRGMLWVAVTDEGALPGRPLTVPEVGEGYGLRLVDRLAQTWGWCGENGGPLMVWALVDPRGHRGPGPERKWVIPKQRSVKRITG